MTVTVYSKPSCVKCNATYRALDKVGVDYTVIDVMEDHDARDYVIKLGHQMMPVVVVDRAGETEHWSDYRRDRIDALATA